MRSRLTPRAMPGTRVAPGHGRASRSWRVAVDGDDTGGTRARASPYGHRRRRRRHRRRDARSHGRDPGRTRGCVGRRARARRRRGRCQRPHHREGHGAAELSAVGAARSPLGRGRARLRSRQPRRRGDGRTPHRRARDRLRRPSADCHHLRHRPAGAVHHRGGGRSRSRGRAARDARRGRPRPTPGGGGGRRWRSSSRSIHAAICSVSHAPSWTPAAGSTSARPRARSPSAAARSSTPPAGSRSARTTSSWPRSCRSWTAACTSAGCRRCVRTASPSAACATCPPR